MQRIDRHTRETFIADLLKQVPTATRAHALRLLRWGATYGRLAEATCNGDWPADDGKHDTNQCEACERGWQTDFSRGCPSCRAERIIRETCESMGEIHQDDGAPFLGWVVTPDFQGDPRGHTVRLQIAGAPLDAYERAALAVPTS